MLHFLAGDQKLSFQTLDSGATYQSSVTHFFRIANYIFRISGLLPPYALIITTRRCAAGLFLWDISLSFPNSNGQGKYLQTG